MTNYCLSKLPSLTYCQGVKVESDQNVIAELSEKLILDHGRNGDPDRCLRLMNSSQHLDLYPPNIKLTSFKDITSICIDDLGLTNMDPLGHLFELRYISFCNNNITAITPLKSSIHLLELHGSSNKLKDFALICS